MAFRNKKISNSITGQDLEFIQVSKDTNGAYLEMQTTYNSKSQEPPAHYHPNQSEDFRVLSGQLTVRIDGQLKILHEGDTLHIPKNQVHSMWNNSDEKTQVYWKIHPALVTEYFLETVIGLSADGKTNENGVPGILQLALTAYKYSNEFRISKPPFFLQKILFLILTPFSYLLGFLPTYKKYLD